MRDRTANHPSILVCTLAADAGCGSAMSVIEQTTPLPEPLLASSPATALPRFAPSGLPS